MSLLLITPVVAFYMLRDWDKFIAKVDSLLPVKSQESIREQAREIDCTLAGFIRGQSSVCLILGTYYSLGLYFVGLELGKEPTADSVEFSAEFWSVDTGMKG